MAQALPSVVMRSPSRSRRATWRDLVALTRPRVTLVAALTGGPALALGRGWPDAATCGAALAALVLLGAGCSALNAWLERDRDGLMARTRGRPLPAGRLEPNVALGFGIATAAGAIALLGLRGGTLAALLGALTLAVYLGPYTLWAKPRTAWSAVIGALPGAAAPLIADAAASGGVGPWGWTLFAIVFLWQPAHVWAIELFRARELAEAGLPTMPALVGDEATRRRMMVWVAALIPVTLLPWFGGTLGPLYAAAALGGGIHFARSVAVAMREREPRADRRAFMASLVHMLLVFGAMLAELALRSSP